jgi:hypothetical protein
MTKVKIFLTYVVAVAGAIAGVFAALPYGWASAAATVIGGFITLLSGGIGTTAVVQNRAAKSKLASNARYGKAAL